MEHALGVSPKSAARDARRPRQHRRPRLPHRASRALRGVGFVGFARVGILRCSHRPLVRDPLLRIVVVLLADLARLDRRHWHTGGPFLVRHIRLRQLLDLFRVHGGAGPPPLLGVILR